MSAAMTLDGNTYTLTPLKHAIVSAIVKEWDEGSQREGKLEIDFSSSMVEISEKRKVAKLKRIG